ncbi:hypothetical protein GOP47_0011624 [Adiantum capillus-veneris]|uniref:Uncharacterized protein n=1 Tax=Adiantum capillus-veneris TaxID=13818 RepID=A0A9D4UTA6_ADICA|nr:hypothetical protein GOP47_0011624 [Adiantum capillus-veneris]
MSRYGSFQGERVVGTVRLALQARVARATMTECAHDENVTATTLAGEIGQWPSLLWCYFSKSGLRCFSNVIFKAVQKWTLAAMLEATL